MVILTLDGRLSGHIPSAGNVKRGVASAPLHQPTHNRVKSECCHSISIVRWQAPSPLRSAGALHSLSALWYLEFFKQYQYSDNYESQRSDSLDPD